MSYFGAAGQARSVVRHRLTPYALSGNRSLEFKATAPFCMRAAESW